MQNEGNDMNYAPNGSGGAGQIPFSSSGSVGSGASGTGAPSKASSLQNYHMLAFRKALQAAINSRQICDKVISMPGYKPGVSIVPVAITSPGDSGVKRET